MPKFCGLSRYFPDHRKFAGLLTRSLKMVTTLRSWSMQRCFRVLRGLSLKTLLNAKLAVLDPQQGWKMLKR